MSLGSIEFLATNQAETISLRVAKWQGSYQENGELRDEFIDAGPDPDRFFVRLIAPNLNTSPLTRQWQGLYVGTQSPNAAYDDDMTIIQLVETHADSGVFVSQSQILVGDAVDDAGRGQHGIATTAFLDAQDDQDQIPGQADGDRTHRIALGGVVNGAVLVEGNPCTYYNRIVVPRVKLIRCIKVYIPRLVEDGDPVTDAEDVLADIAWANERLAQVGVFIEINPETDIEIVDPPNGVDLLDHFDDFVEDLTDEEKYLFDALGTAEEDDIVIFYVNKFITDASGEATPRSYFPNEPARRVNNVVIAAETKNRATPAHELGHVLLNAGDAGEQRHVMYGWQLSHSDVRKVRRWTSAQENTIQGSAFVEDPQ